MTCGGSGGTKDQVNGTKMIHRKHARRLKKFSTKKAGVCSHALLAHAAVSTSYEHPPLAAQNIRQNPFAFGNARKVSRYLGRGLGRVTRSSATNATNATAV